MFKHLQKLLLFAALSVPWAMQSQGTAITSFPFSCDFEDTTDNAYWSYQNSTAGWFIGTATNNGGTHALYVSEDNGSTSSYSGSACVSYAYLTFDITAPGQYAVQFDWKCNGESSYDFLRVAVAPSSQTLTTSYSDWTSTSVPSGFIAIDGGSKLNLQTTWQTQSGVVSFPAAGTYRLLFVWRNDGSVYNQPPAAIDNVIVTELTCPQPTALSVIPSADQLDISWTAGGDESEWKLVVSGGSDNIVQYLTDTFYTATNLTPQTLYSIAVYAICGVGDTSLATTTSVRTTCLPIQTLPYTQNFDAVTTSTTAATGVQVPCWDYIMTGSSTYQTGSYLPQVYYSTTYANSGSYSYRLYGEGYHMLPPMPVDLSQLQLKFADYTTSASYGLVVGVMEGTTFVPIQTINTPASTHVTHTVYFNNYTGTSRVIAFRNYYTTSTSTYYSYHYLDDIEVDNIPACPDIVSHSVTATASAALISWNYDANFGVTPEEYTVSYSLLSDSLAGATTTTVTDPIVMITGLTPDSAYMVSIMTSCTDGDGRAHIFTFNTQTLPCLEWDTTDTGGSSSPTATYVVGTPGTLTTNVMPVNGAYNYSYCNHLILRSDIPTVPQGTTYFSGIDFQYAGTTPMVSKTNCTIYMCHTTMTLCDNFANPADLVLVYEGPLNCTTTGWNHFEFNRGTFAYNGTSNIIVAIVDNSGAHNSGETFYYENVGTSRSHRVYRDNAPYTFAELGTVTAGNSVWRSNMHLTTGGTGGGTCITTASCAAPALEVGQDANGDILLTWLPGYQESDWDIDYRAVSDSTWTPLLTATTLNQYTVSLSDLLPNTQYEFRVTANCSDTNISTTEEYTTPCSFFDVPFTESFDTWSTTAADPLPNCWEKHTNYTTNYPNASTSYAHTGTKAMYMYSTSSTYSYMVLPQFNVAIDSTVVSFWLYKTNTSYSHNVLVGVMTDPADFSTFEQVASVAPTALSTWEPFEITLNTYTGTGRYIAIVSPNNVYSYPYLDDLRIDRISDCPRVTNVAASNITQTDATISWTATNAAEYEVQYGPTGFTFGTGTIETNITADSIDLTGLTSNTPYDVYVRGVCTDDSSNWSFVYTFRTACGQISILPFTEDFENQPTGTSSTSSPFIPCWTRINNGTSYGGYPYVSSSSSYNHTQGGTKGLYWYNTTTTGTYGDYQYIVLPELDTLTNPVNTLQLSFWAKSSSTSYSPVFQVGVKSSITDTAMTVVGTVNVGNSTVWTEYITSFAGYTGNGGYIAIRALRPTSSWYAYVDDITLELIPACPRIEDLHAINATLDSITIVWTDTSSTNTSWVVEYDSVDFTPGDGTVTPIIVTDTVYSLSGLDSATTYHIYVYPECDDYVGFRHITAATLAASPATVPYICGFEENGPNGWDLLNDGQTNYWMVGNSTNNGGTQSLYITNNGIANAYTTSAISYSYAIRTFNFSQAGEYAYTYDWKCQGESHNYDFARIFVTPASEMFSAGDVLGGSTYSFATAAAPSNWIELTQSGATPNTLSQSSTWQTVIGTFTITNPGNYKFVIVWANDGSGGTNPPIAIDNVALQMNECPMVQNVTAALSADSININWMAGGDENEWVVTIDSTSISVTDTFYTFVGLSPNTNYSVSVRAVCGPGDTSLAYSEVYHTPCTALPVPYTENFDNLTTGTATTNLTVMPSCWDYILTGSSSYQGASYHPGVYYSSSYSHSGNYCLRLYGVGYFMLPPFTTPLDSLQLTFWDYTTSASYGLEVGVMEGNNFIPVQVVSTPASTHAEVQVFFGSYTGNSRIIAFRNYYTTSTTTGYSYHYIDNINVDYIPSCPHVTNLTSTGNTATSVTIDWVENGGATEWEVAAEATATATPSGGSVVNAHPYTINGLTVGTNYYIWVRPICGIGDTGLWEGPLMVTPGSWNMRANMTDTLHMCGGVIYDDGGPSGNYSMSQNSYVILYPDAPNNLVSISGTATIEGNSYDKLFIYDGVGTSGTQLVGLQGTSYSSGTTVSATSTSGPLTIYFTTDGSVAYSGFALNVSCITTTCLVTNLALDTNVSATATSLGLMWDAVTDATNYQIEYGAPGFSIGTGTQLTSNTNSIVITGLDAMSNYEVYVRSICSGGDTGSWAHRIFNTTMCDNPTMAYSYDTTMSSTTSSYGPIGYSFYNYGYVQTLIPASRLTDLAGDITAFSFFPTVTTAGDEYESMTVWLANVSDSNLNAGAITPDSAHVFVKVIDNASFSYTTTGEQIHGFDTAFTWDGVSNLLVSVKRDNGSYTSGATFSAHSTPQTMTRYFYQDSGPISHTAPSASSTGSQNLIGDLLFYSCGLGCARPTTLPATDVTYQSATLNWNSTATDFEVAVKAVTDATWPAEVAVSNATSYAVSSLAPATNYQFRVRAVCDAAEGLISDWVEGTFVTDSLPCFVPDGIQVVSTGYTTATIQWNADASQSQWSIHVWNSANDFVFDAQTNPFTVTGLAQNLEYNVAVKAVCGGGYTESEYSDTITFTTGQCAQVTGVNVTGITSRSAVVNWTPTGAPRYKVEYGDRGFPQGTGTTVFVENGQTSLTLENLAPDNNYSVFVMAICEEGVEGAWSERYDFATLEEQGIDVVNGNMNLSIYPNPTSDATTIALSGVNGEVQIVIVDMNGRTVMSDSMSCEGDCTKRMEVSGLAQGAYFVRVSGEGVNQVKKLVVK